MLCLPAILSAHAAPPQDPGSRIYRFYAPSLKSLGRSSNTTSATRVGDWEVTVVLDVLRCEISCAYRLKRDVFGRTHSGSLLPPVAEIHLDTGFGSPPITLIVDPAGLLLPSAARTFPISQDKLCVPTRKFFTAAPQPECGCSPRSSSQPRELSSATNSAAVTLAAVPLRT